MKEDRSKPQGFDPYSRFLKSCSMSEMPRGPNGRRLCRWCWTEVTPPRRTFCSKRCVSEFLIRSNAGVLRKAVFRRDRGMCKLCEADNEYGYWEADHIVPVSEGGGCCGLENMRTLCGDCHNKETAKLKRRLSLKRFRRSFKGTRK